MLAQLELEEYEPITEIHICDFHKKHPGQSYAGCTCFASYGLKRRPLKLFRDYLKERGRL